MAVRFKINHLVISWGVSRGRETYGYNICRLDSRDSGKRYRCSGGGYDMTGTVIGDWFTSEHQEELKTLVSENQHKIVDSYCNGKYKKIEDFYGLTINPDGSVTLDGACGRESMYNIIRACGFEVQGEYNKKGHLIGLYVSKQYEDNTQ